jgi:hypothetical protein
MSVIGEWPTLKRVISRRIQLYYTTIEALVTLNAAAYISCAVRLDSAAKAKQQTALLDARTKY